MVKLGGSSQGAAAGMGFRSAAVRVPELRQKVPSESSARLPSCYDATRRCRVPRPATGGPSMFRVQLLNRHPVGGPSWPRSRGRAWRIPWRIPRQAHQASPPGCGPAPDTRLSARRRPSWRSQVGAAGAVQSCRQQVPGDFGLLSSPRVLPLGRRLRLAPYRYPSRPFAPKARRGAPAGIRRGMSFTSLLVPWPQLAPGQRARGPDGDKAPADNRQTNTTPVAWGGADGGADERLSSFLVPRMHSCSERPEPAAGC